MQKNTAELLVTRVIRFVRLAVTLRCATGHASTLAALCRLVIGAAQRARQNGEMPTTRFPQAVCYFSLLSLACLASGGCTQGVPEDVPEVSFAAQVEAVRSKESTVIQLQATPVSDSQLELLRGLETLTELQLEEGKITDVGLAALSDCPQLEVLKLRHSPISDRGMQTLGSCQQLRVLNLPHAQFSDQGLAAITSLPQLELLRFHSPKVTDDGLRVLAEAATKLRFLHLIDVAITDAGLEHVMGIPNLESLYIDGGELSRPAIERLFTQRPDLHVHFNQQHFDFDPQRHTHDAP